MVARCMWKTPLPRPAASFASASGMVTAGASAASRSATDLNEPALRRHGFKTRPIFRPGFCFSMLRADRTQHRFARPAIDLEPGRFLVGPERRAGLHPRLAVDLVGIQTKPRELALHGLD